MKSVMVALILLLAATAAFAQLAARPGDSVIIESKAVASNLTGSPAFVVKVSITNKDPLSGMNLSLAMQTISGTGYALLNRDATGQLTYASVVNNLTNTLRYYNASSFSAYNDASPDAFRIEAFYDVNDPATIEPPNAVRKPVWELKFRHSSDSCGQILFSNTFVSGAPSFFTTNAPLDYEVNFVPGVLSVCGGKGDLNLAGDDVTGADIVWELRCIFLGETPPAGRSACDLNCDGEIMASDVVVMLIYNFVTLTWPC